jgi:hypothetical protein
MEKKNTLLGNLIPQQLLLRPKLQREALREALMMIAEPKVCSEERQ